jgi:hypothetical protein
MFEWLNPDSGGQRIRVGLDRFATHPRRSAMKKLDVIAAALLVVGGLN